MILQKAVSVYVSMNVDGKPSPFYLLHKIPIFPDQPKSESSGTYILCVIHMYDIRSVPTHHAILHKHLSGSEEPHEPVTYVSREPASCTYPS